MKKYQIFPLQYDENQSVLKIFKSFTLLLGCAFFLYLICVGFGFWFIGSDDACEIFGLLPSIILMGISYPFPRLGGILLICDSIIASFLKFFGAFYVDGLSMTSVINNYVSYTQKYYFFKGLLIYCGPIILFGCVFFFIGLKEKSTRLINEQRG